jgi:hypothetical protein
MIGDHGVIERPPLMEGRSLFIVMAPPTAKAERREGQAEAADGATDGGGETIGEALQAKGQVPEVGEEPPAAAPA